MYPVNFTEKMSENLTHAHTVCTRPSLSQREGSGDEAIVLVTLHTNTIKFCLTHMRGGGGGVCRVYLTGQLAT